MTEIIKTAEAKGFEDGWYDGFHSSPRRPHPPIAAGLRSPGASRAFQLAYHDAYEAGRKERARLEALLKTRVHRDAQVKERDDV